MDDPSILIDKLQAFVDGLLKAMSKGKFSRAEVVAQWASEIQAGAKEGEGGHRYAPDQYTMSMHPKDYVGLTEDGNAEVPDYGISDLTTPGDGFNESIQGCAVDPNGNYVICGVKASVVDPTKGDFFLERFCK